MAVAQVEDGYGARLYLINKVGMPMAPVVFESRRFLIVYGDWTIFLQRPISAALLAISAAAVLLFPAIYAIRKRRTLAQAHPNG